VTTARPALSLRRLLTEPVGRLTLTAVVVVTIFAGVLPRITDQASTSISTTVPVGFAFGVGTPAAMYHSFGISPAVITRAVGVTGIWNNLVKLAMPARALTGLVAVRNAPTGPTVAAVLGSVLPLGLGAWLLWSHGAGRVTTSSEPAGVAS
jgi:hypothetical protein